jgi:hypothetical protein
LGQEPRLLPFCSPVAQQNAMRHLVKLSPLLLGTHAVCMHSLV